MSFLLPYQLCLVRSRKGMVINFTTLLASGVLRLSWFLLRIVEGRLLPSLDYLSGHVRLWLCLFHSGVKDVLSNVQASQ